MQGAHESDKVNWGDQLPTYEPLHSAGNNPLYKVDSKVSETVVQTISEGGVVRDVEGSLIGRATDNPDTDSISWNRTEKQPQDSWVSSTTPLTQPARKFFSKERFTSQRIYRFALNLWKFPSEKVSSGINAIQEKIADRKPEKLVRTLTRMKGNTPTTCSEENKAHLERYFDFSRSSSKSNERINILLKMEPPVFNFILNSVNEELRLELLSKIETQVDNKDLENRAVKLKMLLTSTKSLDKKKEIINKILDEVYKDPEQFVKNEKLVSVIFEFALPDAKAEITQHLINSFDSLNTETYDANMEKLIRLDFDQKPTIVKAWGAKIKEQLLIPENQSGIKSDENQLFQRLEKIQSPEVKASVLSDPDNLNVLLRVTNLKEIFEAATPGERQKMLDALTARVKSEIKKDTPQDQIVEKLNQFKIPQLTLQILLSFDPVNTETLVKMDPKTLFIHATEEQRNQLIDSLAAHVGKKLDPLNYITSTTQLLQEINIPQVSAKFLSSKDPENMDILLAIDARKVFDVATPEQKKDFISNLTQYANRKLESKNPDYEQKLLSFLRNANIPELSAELLASEAPKHGDVLSKLKPKEIFKVATEEQKQGLTSNLVSHVKKVAGNESAKYQDNLHKELKRLELPGLSYQILSEEHPEHLSVLIRLGATDIVAQAPAEKKSDLIKTLVEHVSDTVKESGDLEAYEKQLAQKLKEVSVPEVIAGVLSESKLETESIYRVLKDSGIVNKETMSLLFQTYTPKKALELTKYALQDEIQKQDASALFRGNTVATASVTALENTLLLPLYQAKLMDMADHLPAGHLRLGLHTDVFKEEEDKNAVIQADLKRLESSAAYTMKTMYEIMADDKFPKEIKEIHAFTKQLIQEEFTKRNTEEFGKEKAEELGKKIAENFGPQWLILRFLNIYVVKPDEIPNYTPKKDLVLSGNSTGATNVSLVIQRIGNYVSFSKDVSKNQHHRPLSPFVETHMSLLKSAIEEISK